MEALVCATLRRNKQPYNFHMAKIKRGQTLGFTAAAFKVSTL